MHRSEKNRMAYILKHFYPSAKSVREIICLKFSYNPSDEGARSVRKKEKANTFTYRPR